MKLSHRALVLTLPLVALACGDHDHDHDHGPDGHSHDAAADPAVPSEQASVYALACGCSLPEVGHCSEWAEVAGEHIELDLPLDLGYMPFCNKDGLQARMDATVEDGRLVATTFAYVE